MKLKVIKEFKDKNTNEIQVVGKVIEVTEERGKEILSSPHNVAEIIKEKKTKSKE